MDLSADACGILQSTDVGSQKDRVVTEEEWLQKWEMHNIGFHEEQGHPYVTSRFCLSCLKECCEMRDLTRSKNSQQKMEHLQKKENYFIQFESRINIIVACFCPIKKKKKKGREEKGLH